MVPPPTQEHLGLGDAVEQNAEFLQAQAAEPLKAFHRGSGEAWAQQLFHRHRFVMTCFCK